MRGTVQQGAVRGSTRGRGRWVRKSRRPAERANRCYRNSYIVIRDSKFIETRLPKAGTMYWVSSVTEYIAVTF
jgi:hypothetical protein